MDGTRAQNRMTRSDPLCSLADGLLLRPHIWSRSLGDFIRVPDVHLHNFAPYINAAFPFLRLLDVESSFGTYPYRITIYAAIITVKLKHPRCLTVTSVRL